MPSRVKKLRHEEELAALSETERQNELKARERQLAEISALMHQRPDQFGEVSLADLSHQMTSLYAGF
ncbi:unnamed protein product [Dibothriocephalus latus]|uniref:Matrix-remodeling-associated protein 7 helical domain-containing protein n=1 Tax=Dibothriocephalus latus TaxID=60516 RepID=A0A3P7Q9T1_DIBLA|nr:unnamed protein product [Dibothriocephalus latus]